MKKTYSLLILILSIQILLAQGEKSHFDFEEEYRINPHVSFSAGESSYIICNYFYYDSEANIRKGNIHILEFDRDKNYKNRKILEFKKSNPKEVLIKKVIKNDNSHQLFFLKEKNDGYEFFLGDLDIKNLKVENEKLQYSIDFPKTIWNQHNRIIENEGRMYLLSLDSKNKSLLIYSLDEKRYNLKTFKLEKKVFRNLKADFDFFQNSKISNEYLDYSYGLKFHFLNDNLYLVNTNYNKKSLSIPQKFPFDILKFNLKTGEYTKKVIEKTSINEKYAEVSFSLIDDYLFCTYAFDNKIVLEKLNLVTFETKKVNIIGEDINSINIKPIYSKYNKDSEKTITEEIEFKKFYNKFKNSPAISVIRTKNSTYQIRIGRVAYKAYNSFGDWLGSFATSTVLGSLSSFASNQQFYFHTYSLRNDVPRIYALSFSYSNNDNSILKLETEYSNQKRQIVLDNLRYFINKEMVSAIGSSSEGEPNTFLYRKKSNWKKFYVYSFED